MFQPREPGGAPPSAVAEGRGRGAPTPESRGERAARRHGEADDEDERELRLNAATVAELRRTEGWQPIVAVGSVAHLLVAAATLTAVIVERHRAHGVVIAVGAILVGATIGSVVNTFAQAALLRRIAARWLPHRAG